MERLAEIKESLEKSEIRVEGPDPEAKKMKMISVLEGWLSKIQEGTSTD